MEFSIAGKGNLHGDGFALWVTKERAQPGDVFGHADRFEGLGLFFDTYKNNRPGVVFPYVMAMIGDGKTTYDRANDGKANELGGCSVSRDRHGRGGEANTQQARGLRGSSVPSKAKLTYIKDESLSLDLQYKTEGTWTKCFDLKASSSMPLKLPNQAYLGFSAHTGELSDNFDIIDVQTKNLYSPRAPTDRKNAYRNQSKSAEKQGGGGWMWFFFKIILFFGLCGGAYAGYNAYRTKQRYSRF